VEQVAEKQHPCAARGCKRPELIGEFLAAAPGTAQVRIGDDNDGHSTTGSL
jgi:hypothetical protein